MALPDSAQNLWVVEDINSQFDFPLYQLNPAKPPAALVEALSAHCWRYILQSSAAEDLAVWFPKIWSTLNASTTADVERLRLVEHLCGQPKNGDTKNSTLTTRAGLIILAIGNDKFDAADLSNDDLDQIVDVVNDKKHLFDTEEPIDGIMLKKMAENVQWLATQNMWEIASETYRSKDRFTQLTDERFVERATKKQAELISISRELGEAEAMIETQHIGSVSVREITSAESLLLSGEGTSHYGTVEYWDTILNRDILVFQITSIARGVPLTTVLGVVSYGHAGNVYCRHYGNGEDNDIPPQHKAVEERVKALVAHSAKWQGFVLANKAKRIADHNKWSDEHKARIAAQVAEHKGDLYEDEIPF